ncbi:MAG: NAD(P)H-hydrate dehydratase [Clostridia bacterium]|nr:NAD(P)H-hydrate dehydratase [Clostridia bacterium]
MKKVVDVAVMRESDARTIAGGVSGRELMRRAAKGIFESHPWQGPVAIVCGKGNNAGDGFALALLLQEAKIECTVFLLCPSFSSNGAYYYGKCREIGVKIADFTEKTDLSAYSEIVDCIFGTGFSGEVTGIYAQAIRAINASGKFVVSADINSGLNGNNGQGTLFVRSDLTVSIGFLKNGLLLGHAKDAIGRPVNADIGIDLYGGCRYLCEKEDFSAVLRPRAQNSHKGTYGYVSIMGGCTEYAGAVKLANLSCAALRAGCGVAKLIVPESIVGGVSPYLLESTLATMPDENGKMRFDAPMLDRLLVGQAALAVGMGWGRSPEYAKILQHILQNYTIPMVIDADGLNTLSEKALSLLKNTNCKVVLTPHPKEMERLSGVPVAEIAQDPIGVAENFAKKYGVIVLLKGTCTVVTDGETTYLVNRGCAGMATAGSGDVLSGILAGLLGYAPCDALTVACGAYIAGLAGELAERDINSISMLASDTVAHIGQAITLLL